MKISTTTSYHAHLFGEKEALKKLAAVGYDAVDYSMFFHEDHDNHWDGKTNGLFSHSRDEILEYFHGLKQTADSCGLEIGQVHAPAPSSSTIPSGHVKLAEIMDIAVEATAVMGCKHVVIHPYATPDRIYDQDVEHCKAVNMDIYGKLIPTAKKFGVKIAIENMWGWDDKLKKICPNVCSHAVEMVDYIDTLNKMAGEKIFVACVDIGHGNLTGDNPAEMIRILGDRTEVLHIHDTDGVDDLHTLPFLGNINWDQTLKALKETGYKGNFNFEAGTFYGYFGKDFLDESAKFMLDLGKMLVKKYEL